MKLTTTTKAGGDITNDHDEVDQSNRREGIASNKLT